MGPNFSLPEKLDQVIKKIFLQISTTTKKTLHLIRMKEGVKNNAKQKEQKIGKKQKIGPKCHEKEIFY